MKRRQFCQLVGASCATSAVSVGCREAVTSDFGEKPNVLFISIDDLNDWIGFLGGHPQAKTPNLDRLAQQGINFTRAYCNSPACNPSRTSVLTGIPAHKSGVYSNKSVWRSVLPKAITIPQLFQNSGYWVGGSGKIYHSLFEETEGWDEVQWRDSIKPDSPQPQNIPLNGIKDGKSQLFDWGGIDANPDDMKDAKVVRWIEDKLQTEREKPSFIACGIYRPHLPWYIPPRYLEPFPLKDIQLPLIKDDDLNDVPSIGRKIAKPEKDHANVIANDQYRQAVQAYLASIYFADDMLGRVLDALEASPYAENTIVVLWSDHGWHLGEKLHWRKFTLWEEATRVPLLFKVPKGTLGLEAGTQAGEVCNRPVNLLDIYKTLAELCGLTVSPSVSGRSLVPLLSNPQAAWEYPSVTTWRQHSSVRSEQFRLIQYRDGSLEFYDHQTDPNEWTNLAQNPEYQSVIVEHQQWVPLKFAPPAPLEAAI